MNNTKVYSKPTKSKAETIIRLVSLEEAGRILGVSSRTIRRMSKQGILPPIVKVRGSARISWQGIQDYYNSLYPDERGCTI